MLGLISNASILSPISISIPITIPQPRQELIVRKGSFSLQTAPKRFAIYSKNGDDEREEGSSSGLKIKWSDLLNPDPDNLFAVALSGLLAWASLQVLGQLVLISLAILVAALKYSFIAALLIFILITLL